MNWFISFADLIKTLNCKVDGADENERGDNEPDEPQQQTAPGSPSNGTRRRFAAPNSETLSDESEPLQKDYSSEQLEAVRK